MTRAIVSAALAILLALAGEAQAQYLGTFSWQMGPYCNVITLKVTQVADVYSIEGTDDQCGAPHRASADGTAFINPNGSVGLGFSIVTTPGGVPEHVDATISLATLSGTWRDSAGRTGAFIFTSGPGSGAPRPPVGLTIPDASITAAKLGTDAVDGSKVLDGSIGASDVNLNELQRRIAAPCAAGQAITGVNADGSVTCAAISAGAGGDITAVTAGLGLLGGGSSDAVSVAVNFGGTGTANAVARSDHTHEIGSGLGNTGAGINALAANTNGANNTAIGWTSLDVNTTGAMNTAVGSIALGANVSGTRNTALGYRALAANTASDNTAVGYQALGSNTTGDDNVAVGTGALDSNTTGLGNVAVGPGVLGANQAGSNNTAIGPFALNNLSTGSNNIAIGSVAGSVLTSGSGNIYLGNSSPSNTEDNTIRIGRSNTQTRFFIAGARDVTTGQNNAVTLLIDSTGQLGTVSSTRRVKEDVHDLGGVGRKLQQLRPVRFRYIKPFADGSKPVQYGLIAEEVEQVLPELVARDEDGEPTTVLYHVLPALLLEEIQRLERERAALTERVQMLSEEVAALRDAMRR